MPRIDPLQLLNCLTVLLNPKGGILSKNEVQRLASLMTKFSKKLVSKCVYILILKSTDTQLLGQFMLEGGWNLVHLWMQDGINNKNWSLVTELLELLLMAPTDIEQLKTNNLPKLVKSLTKRDDTFNICELSNELVENWLKIVKESQNKPLSTIPNNILTTIGGFEELTGKVQQPVDKQPTDENQKVETIKIVTVKKSDDKSVQSESYKIARIDGKAVLCKIAKIEAPDDHINDIKEENSEKKVEKVEDTDVKKKDSEKKEKSNHDRHKNKTSNSKSSSSGSSSSSSSRDKDRDRNRDKSSKDKSRSSSSSSTSSSKDKSRSDKHRSNGAKSTSKSSSKDKKDSKEKQAEKDKDTLTKIQPQALQKIGRIPKKDEKSSKEETKKPTFSIEVRKGTDDKPKTVKVFNAKMRSTGLLDEPKPPPPRTATKKTVVAPLPNIPPPKRPSPLRESIPPPEKKSRLESTERPGSIKLIPPKPKPAVLQESDIFMDALTASANTKKEPKKRKRRTSVSKDTPSSPSEDAPSTPTTPTTSLITPANFYQDTLNTENGEKSQDNEEPKDEEGSTTPTDGDGKMEIDENKVSKELKGVLVHVKKKGPKRSIRWKADNELVEVQYFELDETERINVYKTFGEMSKMEMCGERQALQMSRNRPVPIDDNMEPKTVWRHLIEIDIKPPLVEPGIKSLEKDIQFAREKTTVSLPPFIRLADSPAEPDPEVHQMTDPIPIPLEDPENSEVADSTAQPWPEPKGSPPHVPQVQQMFPIPPTFPNFNIQNQPPPQFQNGPFGAPNMMMPPNMMPGNINMAMNGPNMIPAIPMNPEIMNPPNMFQGPKPENFNNEFPQFNPNPNMMFPQNNFNMRGRGGFRGRGGMGNGPWVRMNGPGPGPWNQRGGGGGMPPRGAPPGRICKNVRNHGYCRNSNNCPFFHPN